MSADGVGAAEGLKMNEWVEALIDTLSVVVPETSRDHSWRYALFYLAGLIGLLVLGFWLVVKH
jgi:hypothetical protein